MGDDEPDHSDDDSDGWEDDTDDDDSVPDLVECPDYSDVVNWYKGMGALRSRVAGVVRKMAQQRLDQLTSFDASKLPSSADWQAHAAVANVVRQQHIDIARRLLQDLGD